MILKVDYINAAKVVVELKSSTLFGIHYVVYFDAEDFHSHYGKSNSIYIDTEHLKEDLVDTCVNSCCLPYTKETLLKETYINIINLSSHVTFNE